MFRFSFLKMIYLIQVHVVPSPVAPLFGFTAALATTLKGVLWVFEEFYCGWCTIGHNAPLQIFISWTLPTAYVCCSFFVHFLFCCWGRIFFYIACGRFSLRFLRGNLEAILRRAWEIWRRLGCLCRQVNRTAVRQRPRKQPWRFDFELHCTYISLNTCLCDWPTTICMYIRVFEFLPYHSTPSSSHFKFFLML
jgi:hypothetical protein